MSYSGGSWSNYSFASWSIYWVHFGAQWADGILWRDQVPWPGCPAWRNSICPLEQLVQHSIVYLPTGLAWSYLFHGMWFLPEENHQRSVNIVHVYHCFHCIPIMEKQDSTAEEINIKQFHMYILKPLRSVQWHSSLLFLCQHPIWELVWVLAAPFSI